MTAVSIRKDYRSRLDSSDVVSVTKVLKLHILERKLIFFLFLDVLAKVHAGLSERRGTQI